MPHKHLKSHSNIFFADIIKKAIVKRELIFTFFIFRPLGTAHIYLVVNTLDRNFCIGIRFYSATYYFQCNPLFSALLNIEMKEMV